MRCSFFFVSSRRRHTRLQGDWSSDVCSSDLSTKRTRRVKLRAIVAAPHRRTRLFPFLPASNSLLLPERTVLSLHSRCSANASQSMSTNLQDRKSTRLNSSHLVISYAVFCLKKKKITNHNLHQPS